MTTQDPIVIVGTARTPMGGFQGDLAAASASDLGAVAIRAALERDQAFRRCLSDKEAQAFDKALGKIADEARALIQAEKGLK